MIAIGALLALAGPAQAARTVYFADPGADAIAQYAVGPGGALTALAPASVAADGPFRLAMTRSGKLLYATADHGVLQYDLAVDGRLTPKAVPILWAGGDLQSIAAHPTDTSVYVTDAQVVAGLAIQAIICTLDWSDVFVVFVVSHLVGDFILQTEWQAQHKRGGLGPDPVARRALAAHVVTYTLAFVPAFVWLWEDLGPGVFALAALLAGTHYVQDDGRVLAAYARTVKHTDPVQHPAVIAATDQSFHAVVLLGLALLTT